MILASPARRGQRGQLIVLFALSLTAIVLVVGLVIDGGNALVQRRGAQNAADFAALAGARIVAENISGDTANGSDANVKAAIMASIAANQATPILFGLAGGPVYIDSSGAVVTASGTPLYVGSGAIPAGAVGVKLTSSRAWTPFFLGILGVTNWTASADATAKGGYSAGGPAGQTFPIGIAEAFYNGRQPCAGPVSASPSDPCYPVHLTPGSLNVPGGFGWLKFGCAADGLGQSGGCQNNKPFLQKEIDGNSYGCCTQVGQGSLDRIGSLPGNKDSANCSYVITNNVVITVPVWDSAGGTGSNAYYHIVGFTGFQITDCNGGKDISGVWRVPFYLGPTTTTPGFAGAPLGVELIR